MPRAELHDYQKQMRDFVLRTPYCALFLEMGMGKSLTTLSAIEMMPDSGNVLVIAPKNIARSVWIDEIEKWDINVRYASLIVDERGRKLSPQKRRKAYHDAMFAEEPRMYFLNRDLVCDMAEWYQKNAKANLAELRRRWPQAPAGMLEGYAMWPFPTVVIDEAQSFKSTRAKRFRALKRVRPLMRRVIELSGTPTPSGLEDMWAEMYLLDQGKRLGTSITSYRMRWFMPTANINGHPVNWKVREGCEQQIHQAVADICVSMKNTALKLPPVTHSELVVHMDPAERKVYDKMRKDLFLELPEGEVEAPNAAILTARLSQMASGAIYVDGTQEYAVVHEQKLDMLSYVVRNEPTPVLVAYHFKSDLDMIRKRMEEDGVDARVFDGSPEMVAEWNARRIPVMLVQPASAGHGLNLQAGGHVLVWYTMPWSLEEYLQANARLHRQGQTEPVMIYHIVCDKTIDRRIRTALERKSLDQNKLLEAVRMELADCATGKKAKGGTR